MPINNNTVPVSIPPAGKINLPKPLSEHAKAINKDGFVAKKIHKTPLPFAFTRIGLPTQGRIMTDIINLTAAMSKAESSLFLAIFNSRDWKTNIGILTKLPVSRSEEAVLSRAYNKLKKKGVLKRMKKDTYMINPDLVVPYSHKDTETIWNSLP